VPAPMMPIVWMLMPLSPLRGPAGLLWSGPQPGFRQAR